MPGGALVLAVSCSSGATTQPATCDSHGVCTTTLADYGGSDGCICWSNSLAVGPKNVFWRAYSGLAGTVNAVPIGGGDVTVLYRGQSGTCAVAANDTNVFWTYDGAGDELMTAPIAGGATRTLVMEPGYIAGLALDGSNVYATQQVGMADPLVSSVMKMPLAGGAVTTLASGPVMQGFFCGAVATDRTNVYVANVMRGGNIMSVPVDGGLPTLLATDQEYPSDLAVHRTNVFWTTNGQPPASNGTVMTVPTTGGAPVTLASGLFFPTAIAVDDTSIYLSTGTSGNSSIMKMPLRGGTPTKIATCDRPGVAVDARSVYFFNDDHVVKLTPK